MALWMRSMARSASGVRSSVTSITRGVVIAALVQEAARRNASYWKKLE
jgi:hypothetical protein